MRKIRYNRSIVRTSLRCTYMYRAIFFCSNTIVAFLMYVTEINYFNIKLGPHNRLIARFWALFDNAITNTTSNYSVVVATLTFVSVFYERSWYGSKF